MIVKLNSEDGALTLIESLVVLAAVAFLLLLPTIQMKPVEETVETDLFIEQLSSQITLMHQNAVLNGEMTVIEVEPNQSRIRFSVIGNSGSALNQTMYLPDHVTVYGGYKRYSFRPHSGNITTVDRIRFSDSNKTFEFIFQIGSGRFYVKETS